MEGRVDAVALEGRARTVAVRVAHDALGREREAPAGCERARRPGEVLAEDDVGERQLAPGARADRAGDVAEGEHAQRLLERQVLEALPPRELEALRRLPGPPSGEHA